MIWILGGYLWLYVHRPFEVWPALGMLQFERGYMFAMILAWAVTPSKSLAFNRIHLSIAFFTACLLAVWLASPFASKPGTWEVIDNYLKVCVFYFLVITTVREERDLRLLVLLFLAAVGLYMAHSLWEFAHGRYQWRMGTRRMIGVDTTFSDPNAFASTLLYSLPMTLPFWYEQPRRVPRWVLIGFVLGVVLCILLTGSRAAFAGLCLLAMMLFVFSAKHKFQAILSCGALGVAGMFVLLVALPEDLSNRYLTLIDSSRGPQNAAESASGRLDGFVHGIEAWQKSPLLGHGPAAFAYVTNRGGQAHNLYGQVLSEMGLLGAMALALLVGCFWFNWRDACRVVASEGGVRPDDFLYQLSRAISINILLLLVMGWSGHNLFRYNWQWLAAFSGVATFLLLRRQSEAAQYAGWDLPETAEESAVGQWQFEA
ncbi:MAG: O-antigen ligase family protein [Gemmataceae bacterium]